MEQLPQNTIITKELKKDNLNILNGDTFTTRNTKGNTNKSFSVKRQYSTGDLYEGQWN